MEDVADEETVVEVVNVVDKVVDTVDEDRYAVLIWLSRYSICSSLLFINFSNSLVILFASVSSV